MDEEFEALSDEFDKVNKNCTDILELLRSFTVLVHEIVRCLREITLWFHTLANATFVDTEDGSSEVETEAKMESRVRNYLAVLDDLDLTLTNSLDTVPKCLEEKIGHLLLYSEHISKHIRKRDLVLLDYDKYYDKHDGMSIMKVSHTFDVKQASAFSSLEKKLELFKQEYDKRNATLKLELPFYFVLVRNFMEYVLQYFFYVQLTITYQFNLNLLSLQKEFKIDKEAITKSNFYKLHVDKFVEENAIDDPDLKIVTFHREYLNRLVERNDESNWKNVAVTNFDPFFRYCKALYNYAAKERDDLELHVGDLVKVIEATGEWWKGELNGRRGRFPRNHVAELT